MILLKRKDDKEEKDIIIQFWSRVAKKVCVQFIILWNILPNSMKMMKYRIIRLFVLFAQSLALYFFTDFYFFPLKLEWYVSYHVFLDETIQRPRARTFAWQKEILIFSDLMIFSFFFLSFLYNAYKLFIVIFKCDENCQIHKSIAPSLVLTLIVMG